LIAVVGSLKEPFPLFGTLAHNDENNQEANLVVKDGKISSAMYAFIAFYGDIKPKFRVATSFSYDDEKNVGDDAEITEAEGPLLKTVNGIPSTEYLKRLGMLSDENISIDWSTWAVPAILTRKDGSKVVRAFLGTDRGTGYIYSAGTLEVGAKISFAYLDGEKTLSSAEKILTEITGAGENNIMIFSCAARSWSLGSQYLSELKKITECAEEHKQKNNLPLNYCVSYSAGEICPLLNDNGELVNTVHNYTLISCSFD
jgi:hypothetical protein